MAKKRYVVSLEVIMDDDENQTQFGNLDMGCLDGAVKNGVIESWDFLDVTVKEGK